jgi:hypothetical protein
MPQRVFVDANVLRSKTQMDWLFLLRNSLESSFQVHSTEDVIAEVAYTMRRDHPDLDGGVIARRLGLVRDSLDEVLSDYSTKIPFSGTDPHDLHLHAAATSCCADLLLTNNKAKDITTTPDEECYEVIRPDEFFMLLADAFPQTVRQVAFTQEAYWRQRSDRTIVEALKRAQCPQFARRVAYEMTTRAPLL